MEAYRTFASVKQGIITIALPDNFNNQSVEVIVLPFEEPDNIPNRLALAKMFKGTAVYPNVDLSQLDVYEQ